MSASIVYAETSKQSAAPLAARALSDTARSAASPDDLVGARLRDLDQRISAADKIATSEANDLQNIANSGAGRRAPAASPSDNIDNLASQVARLAEADDRTARLSADATASVATTSSFSAANVSSGDIPGGRQTPRLADLIKLKRAEIERYEAEASSWSGTPIANGFVPSDRRAKGFGAPGLSPATDNSGLATPRTAPLNGAGHATPPFVPANGYPPTMATPMPAASNGLNGGLVPPSPPAETQRERTSAGIGTRMSELRDEGFSSSLYGFGAGLGIALMSGAALYVVLRLV